MFDEDDADGFITNPLAKPVPRGNRQDNVMLASERVLCIIPKNKSTEHRIVAKRHRNRKDSVEQRFVDFREWWFKNGTTEEPLPTSKGIMVHRHNIAKLVVALIKELEPLEIDAGQIAEIRAEIERLTE